MMSFHHQTDASICQISENQWREVHFMRGGGEHSTCPIKIWRGFAREKLTSQCLLYRPFSDLLFEQASEQVNSNWITNRKRKQKTFCYSEQWNQHKHLDSFWNNDLLIVYSLLYSSKNKRTLAKINAGQCLTHINKLACEIWSCFDDFHFCQKTVGPFFDRALQL